jgi:hypothetical protein
MVWVMLFSGLFNGLPSVLYGAIVAGVGSLVICFNRKITFSQRRFLTDLPDSARSPHGGR